MDRAGKRLSTLGGTGDYGDLELSPDGSRLAVAVLDVSRGTRDIWMFDVASGRRTVFTSDPADENWIAWSPDGRRVIFNSTRRGELDLYQAASTGTALPEIVLADTDPKWPLSWSPDGRYLLFVTNRSDTGNDIRVLPFGDRPSTGSGRPFPYLDSRVAENWASFSPDGHHVAFSSTESGQAEVYVASFPMPKYKRRVSENGGIQARWRRDGKELFFLALDGTLTAVPIKAAGSEVEAGTPESLFELKVPYAQYRVYDLSRDGQQILANILVPAAGSVVAD